ncbi:MAG: arsenate reductase ArsC [Bacillota bacterium]
MDKVKVAFVCVGNSCRSQMAEGFAREYGENLWDVYSAGTHPAGEVNPKAIVAMQEKGIDISDQKPKFLEKIPSKLDVLITMGCNVECPYIPNKYRADWGLDDPVGEPLEVFRETRDIIEEKVKGLKQKVKNAEW